MQKDNSEDSRRLSSSEEVDCSSEVDVHWLTWRTDSVPYVIFFPSAEIFCVLTLFLTRLKVPCIKRGRQYM